MKFEFSGKTLVCGILNITPDSFSDGGIFLNPDRAADRALQMVDEGADMIDIGAESSRPGASPVSAEEEQGRLLPVLKKIRGRINVPVSVDTYKPETAHAVINEGADIINDITGLRSPDMASLVAKTGAGIVIMHMQGTPDTMQENPFYSDVVKEVKDFLQGAVCKAVSEGIPRGNIAIDPGIGFGKNTLHNLQLINNLEEFSGINRPLLIGVSRKSIIGDILKLPLTERLEGTAALVACAALRGASIVRVHDVKPMVRVVRMVDALKNCCEA